ncbi:uncharacterized protein APUU_10124A [Aspergillus puulaauensis]|uniref:Carboxylic ester hydrolase n=1 Tax=Aspergillus puulaauensis TaxID=1220207 RepID=A0A7R7X9G2_9EURO|nr:uncharacterized protein APUU_10124A [Aspergillus puulaauensis]BCS17296.1 hypothetical protein APUU_10124A [Aspergillus puulaauensis]
MLLNSFLGLSVLAVLGAAVPSPRAVLPPTADVLNGTYVGVRNNNYNQDFFLGIPFAQQPVGNLRFALPTPLNETWDEERDAKAYSDICVGYGSDSIWYPQSEACLTLNIIRDSSVDEESALPVGVWIHGGGFYMGSGADERYNMSAIVANSHRIGKPFIGVTINYRLSTWGFLASKEVTDSGITNLGLRDQRLALHWIRENIAAFGGDPDKVTIFGESAGGMSVGSHLIAYGGRDDGLFRGAIMQSGGSVTANPGNNTANQGMYDDIVRKVGCTGEQDTLQCLREVPFEDLNAVFNGTGGNPAYSFWPSIDGDLLQDRGSDQLDKQEFVKVPILAGTNTDEGASFGPRGINTTEQFYSYLTSGQSGFKYPPAIAKEILRLYPDDPSQGIPEFLGSQRVPSMGYQWRRTCAYSGDYSMHANRRRQCEAWAESGTPAYCYRFNTRSAEMPYIGGVGHFTEVAFVFNNIAGLGYHYGKPFDGTPKSYENLSVLMASMWASFIHDLDPNSGIDESERVYWEGYSVKKPVDLVFDANTTSHIEPDTWRKDGIDYINSVAKALWR